jgi:hypothetical protein
MSRNEEQLTYSDFGAGENLGMLVPDTVYARIPLLWMVLGILFMFLGAIVGTAYTLFPLYIGAGFLCIARSLSIYQARWKYFRKNELRKMRSTQTIDSGDLKDRDST